VAFTADPVSGERRQLMINATWGFGESLVGGGVAPDSYTVGKADLTVTGRYIADKRRMTVAVADGTCEVDVPSFLRAQPSLAGDEPVAIARLCVALEEAAGEPVDVECAFRGGQLHLLQCRPITTCEPHSRAKRAPW
jgi:phosphoenolpyruvate synthase/pyruvate phosphate dikinase